MKFPCRFDSHVHSTHSPDSSSDLAAYARQVDAGVADGIGFAEHYDFLPICGAYGTLDERQYLAEIASWRERGYHFYAGVEVDYITSELPAIQAKLREFGFDFVIASIHTLPSGGVSDRSIDHFYDDAIFERMLGEYEYEFSASLKMPGADVIGHPLVFQRNLDAGFFAGKPWKKRIRELEAELARRAANSDKLIEVNCSGFFTPLGTSCATPFFLQEYRFHGGQTITLSSDSHAVDQLRRGMDLAAPILQSLGFSEIYLPWNREHPVALMDYVSGNSDSVLTR